MLQEESVDPRQRGAGLRVVRQRRVLAKPTAKREGPAVIGKTLTVALALYLTLGTITTLLRIL